MLYYLFDYLDTLDIPGAGVFQYISFRAGMAAFISLLITITFGKNLINILRKKQVGEDIRDLGLAGQIQKKGTPTMGGIIIIAAILIPTLLFAQLDNVYVILLIIATCWLGIIGFVDDYIKVFRKNKEGLAGRFKVVGQVGLGLIVGFTLYFNTQVVIREVIPSQVPAMVENNEVAPQNNLSYREVKSTKTTVPFLKNNEFDYHSLIPFFPVDYTWIVYVGVVIFVIIAVSNGANITDGIDGLAAGTSAIIGLTTPQAGVTSALQSLLTLAQRHLCADESSPTCPLYLQQRKSSYRRDGPEPDRSHSLHREVGINQAQ